ncbi:MAG: hypothetical protein HQL87_03230 [Magnetococcales bacterium]|nr:hypothetical protein [Magnetococcales bacterium]
MEAKRIKAAQVREMFGNCSTATLYRMWKTYQILPPPTVIRGINYWTPQEVERAFQESQKAEVKADTTPSQAAPLTNAVDRAANARRGKKAATQGGR